MQSANNWGCFLIISVMQITGILSYSKPFSFPGGPLCDVVSTLNSFQVNLKVANDLGQAGFSLELLHKLLTMMP